LQYFLLNELNGICLAERFRQYFLLNGLNGICHAERFRHMLVKNTNMGEGIALVEPTLLSVFFNFRIVVFPAKWIEMGFVLPNVFGTCW